MTTDAAGRPPQGPAGQTPLRRPNSIRRTSSIDTVWPEGFGLPMKMAGHARDVVTTECSASCRILSDDRLEIMASAEREILEIRTERSNETAQSLVGKRAGGGLREFISTLFARERDNSTPLYLLLDDYAGASLVANWAWTRWMDDAYERRNRAAQISSGRGGIRVGICAGYRPGTSALLADGTTNAKAQTSAVVPELVNCEDPDGWHELPPQSGVGMRRARWMDLWLPDDFHIEMDIGFQDSATSPEGSRVGIHEYRVRATAHSRTKELLRIDVTPHLLPYRECPEATGNVQKIIGLPLESLRTSVPTELFGVLGCTHLNDVIRSMADAPALAGQLREFLMG